MDHAERRQPIETTARVIGAAAAVVWLLPLVGSLIGDDAASNAGEDASLAESLGVVLLAGANIVAVVIAFRRPMHGGRLLLVTGTLFAIFALVTAGRNHWIAVGASGVPFVLSGLLFVAASRRTALPRSGAKEN